MSYMLLELLDAHSVSGVSEDATASSRIYSRSAV